jgi:hypothetical protein
LTAQRRRAVFESGEVGMFGFIGRFLSRLWRVSNFWRIPPFENPTAGVRVGSPLAGGLMFLFLLFFSIALILVILGSMFGFTVEDTLGGADRWLAQTGPTLDFIGKAALRVVLAIVLALCVFGAWSVLRDRFGRNRQVRPGWGKTILLLLGCLLLSYCSAVNLVAPFERYDPSLGSQYYE